MNAIEDQARTVFLAALEVAPDQWPALLDETCSDNAELRKRVDQLLDAPPGDGQHSRPSRRRAGRRSQTFLTWPRPPAPSSAPTSSWNGSAKGAWARSGWPSSASPCTRKVALKIIKAGMDTRQVVARFEAERQALALMDHPNIAKVLDGGCRPQQRPRPTS